MIALYGHPFSSYTWKALIALHEHDLPFDFRVLGPDQPQHVAFCREHQPAGQFPVLDHDGRVVMESNAVVEYVDLISGTPRLVPRDPLAAIAARQMADVFDDYVMNTAQPVVSNALRPEAERNPADVRDASARLLRNYGWLDRWMAGREWAAAGAFTLADIAAAPALFYADWVERIPEEHAALRAYRARLLARPSIVRVVDGARPFRPYFPLGAPDRD